MRTIEFVIAACALQFKRALERSLDDPLGHWADDCSPVYGRVVEDLRPHHRAIASQKRKRIALSNCAHLTCALRKRTSAAEVADLVNTVDTLFGDKRRPAVRRPPFIIRLRRSSGVFFHWGVHVGNTRQHCSNGTDRHTDIKMRGVFVP